MTIERAADELVIRFPLTAKAESVQDLIDTLRYRELTANYSVEQSQVDELAQAINTKWWNDNKSKFQ